MKQILHFGVVGGTAFFIDYGLLYALTEFVGINFLISAADTIILCSPKSLQPQ
ncbi:MAG: hypothetical protein ACC608_03365 [Anaerofustis sp.]